MIAKEDSALKDTGERMIPEFHRDSLIYGEHLTRYIAAEKIVKGKVVLDIASGSGYGTKQLANTAKKVYGIDVSPEAVEYAKQNYPARNIEYLVGDGEYIPLKDNSVDIVVTFETIEHVPNYEQFVKEIKRVLKDDGLAIISTPNDTEFAEGNHYHLHEFTYTELLNLVKKYFTNVDSYYQGTWKYVAVGTDEQLREEGEISLPTLNLAPLKPEQYLYFFLLCSNKAISKKIEPIAAIGAHYSDRAIEGRVRDIEEQLTSQHDNILKEREHLRREIDKRNINIENLEKELTNIKKSKTYRAADKLGRVKRRIRKQ